MTGEDIVRFGPGTFHIVCVLRGMLFKVDIAIIND